MFLGVEQFLLSFNTVLHIFRKKKKQTYKIILTLQKSLLIRQSQSFQSQTATSAWL